MSYIGTRKSDRDKRYRVADVGGIPVGLINYTYQAARADGKPSLNLLLEDAAVPLVNSFDYRRLDDFYNELAGELAAMRRDGALATVVYIHWGNEYRTTPNKQQRAIAQKLCDLGVDVIIGGHPHVVQPLEILTAPDGGRTVCLYSMGNAVSNQRIYRASIKTGHTEDGVLFSVTFRRTGDGPVQISGVDVLPTWVNLYRDGDRDVFQIVPLDTAKDWRTAFDLDRPAAGPADTGNDGPANAENSYERTMALVRDGLEAFRSAFPAAA